MRRAPLAAFALATACAVHRPVEAPPLATAPLSDETRTIDALITQGCSAAKVVPAPAAGDAEYLRRVTLDLTGRIPTGDEARRFLADTAPGKRPALVDRLLASPEYARHWTDVYLALLVGRDQRIAGGAGRALFASYLNRALSENRPFDRVTREILTATGRLDVHPEAAFMVRNEGNGGPEAAAAATARVFLGLQIGCAQCHDHPSDARYHQEDFWGFTSYFAQTAVARGMGEGPGAFIVYEKREGDAQMPVHDTGKLVSVPPKFLGRSVKPGTDETRRDAVASAIIGSDLFAKEAVNRTWAELFGRGLVEPFDDLGGEHDASHPPLLTRLAEAFAAHGYDQRWLLRTIVLSQAYGRSSSGGTGDPETLRRTFARATVRPLQPEQLFRSLLTATGVDEVIERKLGEEATETRMEQALRQYLFVFGDDEMAEVNAFNGSVPEALLVLNGPLVNQGIRARGGSTLDRILRAGRNRDERLNGLFLAVYARPPAPAESVRIGQYLDAHGSSRGAWEDVFHALLTSVESTTNH
jgi:hypothetical protein